MIVETEHITKRFWRHEAVHGLDLAVPEGATYAFVGANGAGKTTTMRMLVNILAPDRGSARVLGIDSRRHAPCDRLRIGYLSENQELPDRLSIDQYFEYLTQWGADLLRRVKLLHSASASPRRLQRSTPVW